jgi:mono/diheme cytochrome c family protein
MLTKRSLSVLFGFVTVLACSGRRADSVETPYAARYAVSRPAYVRPTASAGKQVAATHPTESFADPQFTAAQASAGGEVYKTVCARCHASTQWTGGLFAANWKDRRLSDFYDLVSVTMPQDNPGALTAQQYVDVTAYVLQLAGLPSGSVALRGDSAMLRHARISVKAKVSSDSALTPTARTRVPARS